jgi:hypothetical protein
MLWGMAGGPLVRAVKYSTICSRVDAGCDGNSFACLLHELPGIVAAQATGQQLEGSSLFA